MKLPLNKIKLIVLDIGKTIFDKEHQTCIDEELLNLLKDLQKDGIKIGVCTMRTIDSCNQLFPFKLDFYISLNGTLILCGDKKIIDKRIKNVFLDNPSLTYGVKKMYYSSQLAQTKANENGFLTEEKGTLKYPYVITLFNIEEKSLKYFENYSLSYWLNTKTLTLQHKDCSKVKAIKKILKHYGYNDNELLFFGDGPNDLEVFKRFKYTIMVENGHPCLKEYAFSECFSCLNKGVYRYLEKYKKYLLDKR